MLPKKARLTKKGEIDLLMKKGRWFSGDLIRAKALYLSEEDQKNVVKKNPNNSEIRLKIAISTGLKYSKKATERNQIKRRVAASLEKLMESKHESKKIFVMFVPQPGLGAVGPQELDRSVVSLFNRIMKND